MATIAQDSDTPAAKKAGTDRLIALFLGLSALFTYVLTLSRGAFPGRSTSLIVEYYGLSPRMSPLFPVWGMISRAVADIPVGALTTRMNLVSAVLGALTVAFFYRTISGVIRRTIEIDSSNVSRSIVASRIGGAVASLSLAYSIPFWIVSNRAYAASLRVFMLVVAGWLILQYAETAKKRFALLLAFLYGLGIVEYPTFIALAPFAVIFFMLLMLNCGQLRAKSILQISFCGFVGLLLYLLEASWFYNSVGYHLRDYEGFFSILWYMWRDQFYILTRSLSRSGWLTVFLVTTLPWVTSLVVSRRALNQERDWGFYLLHIVLTFTAVGVLLNVRLSPWALYGHAQIIVAPYLTVAWLLGYLAAYWYLIPRTWWPYRTHLPPILRWWRRRLGLLLAIGFVSLVCVIPFVNLKHADGRPSRIVSMAAKAILESMPSPPAGGDKSEHEWLVGDGSMDDHVLIAAAEPGRHIRIINYRAGNNMVYLKRLAGYFTDPVLQNQAEIGAVPLLEEWFKRDPNAASRTTILSIPDLWMGLGHRPVPNKMAFTAAPEGRKVDTDGLMNAHREFWNEFVPVLKKSVRELEEAGPPPLEEDSPRDDEPRVMSISSAFSLPFLRHTAFVANNLGVFMQDQGMHEYALEAYLKSREIDRNNISALLNLWQLVNSKPEVVSVPSDVRETIDAEMEDLRRTLTSRPKLWALSQYYGYVRTPGTFAELGWAWALSGNPNLAVSGLERAIDMMPDESAKPAKHMLAGLYLSQENMGMTRSIYEDIIAKDPDDTSALLGMARVATASQNIAEAQSYLKRASASGASKTDLAMELAILNLGVGDADRARVVLQGLVEHTPGNALAWVTLGGIMIEQGDETGVSRCIKALADIEGADAYADLLRGHRAFKQRLWPQARRSLRGALKKGIKSVRLQEMLLRIDMIERLAAQARARARELLHSDPNNAFAYYVLGILHIEDERYDLAEESLRRSLALRDLPQTRNDLAWTLLQQGALKEAEDMVKKALAVAPDMPPAWDTLGEISLADNRLDEAEKAFAEAHKLAPEDVRIVLHLAEVKILKKDTKAARKLILSLDERADELSEDAQKQLSKLRERLKSQ